MPKSTERQPPSPPNPQPPRAQLLCYIDRAPCRWPRCDCKVDIVYTSAFNFMPKFGKRGRHG
jgi:hypothetical protein